MSISVNPGLSSSGCSFYDFVGTSCFGRLSCVSDQPVPVPVPVDTGIVINGTFDADEAWTKGMNWVINGGVATRTAPTGGTILWQENAALLAGTTYTFKIDVVRAEGGDVQFVWRAGAGWTLVGPRMYDVGHYELEVNAPSGVLGFGVQGRGSASPGVVSIDNFCMVPV